MCLQNLVKFCPLVLKILSGNEILTSIKAITLLQICKKMTLYNPNLDLINVDVYTKFGGGGGGVRVDVNEELKFL